MRLTITEQECAYLKGLLENTHKELLRELNRTDSLAYKNQLKHSFRLLEGLQSQLKRASSVPEMANLPEEVT